MFNFFMCMPLVYRYPWRLEEAIGPPEFGVTDGFELPDIGFGSLIRSSKRGANILNHSV